MNAKDESNGSIKLKLETQAKLLDLKRILNKVKDISFATSKLTKEYPLDELTQENAEKMIKVFESYVDELRREIA